MNYVTSGGNQHGQNTSSVFLRSYKTKINWPIPKLGDPNDPWVRLANQMKDSVDTPKDAPDSEENPFVPAGYTYFGQFVDHDLTFDTASSLDLNDHTKPSNDRTARFDLDNLYGPGPADAPFMYEDGVKLVALNNDLPRAPNGRAIIGDPRNDENSIVCQIQMAFIRFHNAVVDRLALADEKLTGQNLFEKARDEVRWTYQKILVDDYLKRIVNKNDINEFDKLRKPGQNGLSTNKGAFKVFQFLNPPRIPLEFAGAAYRFGHSMIRNGYRLNANTKKHIFSPSGPDSLVGFGPLPISHLIDWSLFFPDPDSQTVSKAVTPGEQADNNQTGRERLQFAYKIDPTLVDPLAALPLAIAGIGQPTSLALRNLVRGYKFNLPSGQELQSILNISNRPDLVTREKNESDNTQSFVGIPQEFNENSPLWFYILAEAQQSIVEHLRKKKKFGDSDLIKLGTQLTGVGARIVLEVFNGLLDTDPESIRRKAPKGWENDALIKEFRMWDIVTCNLK